MAWRVVLLCGAILAVACAGLAIYADGQPAEARCEETRPLEPGDAGYTPPGNNPEYAELLNELEAICVSEDDAPLWILRSGTTTWWWFAAGAIVILTLAAIPITRRRSAG